MTFLAGQKLRASELQALEDDTTTLEGHENSWPRVAIKSSTSANSTSTTAVLIMNLDNVLLESGQWYTVSMWGHPNSGTATDNIRRELRYNLSGTAGIGDSIVKGSQSFAPVSTGAFSWVFSFRCGDSGYPGAGTASFAFTFARDAGAGTCNFFCDTNRNTGFSVDRGGNTAGQYTA